MDVAHLIPEVWQCLTYVIWKTHKYVAICARPAVFTSNHRSFKFNPCPKPTSFLMAEKVGSASHLQERKGGSSWKLMEQVNCMQKSVEQGIHISLPFISWGRSLQISPYRRPSQSINLQTGLEINTGSRLNKTSCTVKSGKLKNICSSVLRWIATHFECR